MTTDWVDPVLVRFLGSPLGSVPKKNPDRSISEKRRTSHDRREGNLEVSPDFPETRLPTVEAQVRRLLRLKLNWPGLRVLQCKRDVQSAFKIKRVVPEDAGLQGASFGPPVGLRPLRLPLGGSGPCESGACELCGLKKCRCPHRARAGAIQGRERGFGPLPRH